MPDGKLTEEERRLLIAIQDGLPLVERPYDEIALRLGTSQAAVIVSLASLLERGVIKRLAAIPNHYALGITANGMAVWDVPDSVVNELGRRLAARAEVTHCYRRPRRLPDWPFNLYAMVHGRTRDEVSSVVDEIARETGLSGFPHELLFSRRQFRKRGARVSKTNPK